MIPFRKRSVNGMKKVKKLRYKLMIVFLSLMILTLICVIAVTHSKSLSVIREQLRREPDDGDVFIVMSKDRRIVRMFTYDNRSYSLFEKKFVSGYQFMKVIRDGEEKAYRIDWKDVVLLLENPIVKELKIR